MPIGTTAAIIGAGVLGAGASMAGAASNKSAINRSTDAQLAAQREANASQERIANQQIQAYRDNLNTNTALQTNLYNNSGQLNTDIYNQRQQILQPWAAGGGQAFNQINSMLGLGTQKFSAPRQIAFTPITAPAPITGATPAPAAAPAAAFNPTSYANINDLMTAPQYQALNTADRRDARRQFQGVA